MNIGDVIARNERLYRNHPAIVFDGRSTTHGEFADHVKRLSGWLHDHGVQRGARVAILSNNCPEYLEIYGAAAWEGLIGMGMNYRLSADEQAVILRDCEPAVFFFEASYTERTEALRPALPAATLFVCIGPTHTTPAWATAFGDTIAPAQARREVASGQDDDTWLLVYTSGSTGAPKGVMLGNAGQCEQARLLSAAHGASPTDRMLIVMPFYHIGGTTECMTYYINGATILLHGAFKADEILDSVERDHATSAHLAPTMIQMMLDVQRTRPRDLSSLHTVCYASAPMSVPLSRAARAVFGPIFMQVYGMSEAAGTVLLKHQHVLEGTPAEVSRLASAGQPMWSVSIRIVDDDGREVPDGQIGEIWMKSVVNMQGYWKNPTATAAALADGWMKSGDLGYFDDEAFLFIVDRKKDMIVSGGENIYSREVEEALLTHPAVLEASVVGVPDEKWGESVLAVVALKAGTTATSDDLIAHCKALIASYKKPRYVRFVDALPRLSSTNKIDKKALRRQALE